MNALFDIIIVGIILFCAASGYRRGFVRSVMSVVSFAAAFFTARAFAPQLAGYLYARHIRPSFVSALTRQIERFLTPSVDLNSLANNPSPPEAFIRMIRGYGFELPDVQNWLIQAGPADIHGRTEFVAANMAGPVARQFSYFLAFILILIAVLILLKIAVNIIDSLVQLPGLKFINKTGGILAGLVYGIVACFIFVFLASYGMPYLEASGVINAWTEIKNDTLFFKWFYENSPLDSIMGRF